MDVVTTPLLPSYHAPNLESTLQFLTINLTGKHVPNTIALQVCVIRLKNVLVTQGCSCFL